MKNMRYDQKPNLRCDQHKSAIKFKKSADLFENLQIFCRFLENNSADF